MNAIYTPHGAASKVNYTVQPYKTNVTYSFADMVRKPQPNNNVWRSRFSNATVDIQFSQFTKLTDSFTEYNGHHGIYVIYHIPNTLLNKLDTLPVINEYAIYVGESETSLSQRFSQFKSTLDSLTWYEVGHTTIRPSKLHVGATNFYNQMTKSGKVYHFSHTKRFACVEGFTLMVRVAVKSEHFCFNTRQYVKPDWKFSTKDHERVLLSEIRAIYPDILYNGTKWR